MVGQSPQVEDILLVEGLIAFVVLRRTIMMARGTRYSEARLIVSGFLYVILTGSVLVEDAFLFPVWVIGADLAILVAVMFAMIPHTRSNVKFFPGPQGWMYKLPMVVGLVYVTLFIVRTVITLVYAPQLVEAEFGGTSLPTLSGTAYLAVGVVDALFSGSTGLYFGRSAGVVLAAQSLPKAPPPPPTGPAPLPSSSLGSPPQRL